MKKFLSAAVPASIVSAAFLAGAGAAQAATAEPGPGPTGTPCPGVSIALSFLAKPAPGDAATAAAKIQSCDGNPHRVLVVERGLVVNAVGTPVPGCDEVDNAFPGVALDPAAVDGAFTATVGYPLVPSCPGGELEVTVEVDEHGVALATGTISTPFGFTGVNPT